MLTDDACLQLRISTFGKLANICDDAETFDGQHRFSKSVSFLLFFSYGVIPPSDPLSRSHFHLCPLDISLKT